VVSGESDQEQLWEEFRDYGIEDIPELEKISNLSEALTDARFFHEHKVRITGHALRRMQERKITSEEVMNLYSREVDLQAFQTHDFNYLFVNSNRTIGVVTNFDGHIISVLAARAVRSAIGTGSPIFSYEIPWIVF
jgi:hypothetical protein